MEHKPIYVDGVDVSGCEGIDLNLHPLVKCKFLKFKTSDGGIAGIWCFDHTKCNFKQLARKTRECEDLKERLERTEEDLKYQCVDCMNVKSDRYRKALEEIEEYINQYEMLGKLNIKYILDIINKAKGEGMEIKLLQDLFFWLKHLKEISIIMNEVIKIFLKGAFRNPFLLEEIHQEILKQLDKKNEKRK